MDAHTSNLLNRYSNSLDSGKACYFDASEFEDLIDYFAFKNDFLSAREVVDAGLKIHPDSSGLLYRKAKSMAVSEEYEAVLTFLQFEIDGYIYDGYLLKIEAYLQLHHYDEACRLANTLLQKVNAVQDEPISEILAELGFLFVDADYFNEALVYLNKSVELNRFDKNQDDENASLLSVLSNMAYASEMLGNIDDAIKMNNRILDIEPYSYDTWMNIGKLHSMKDEYDNALQAFDFALIALPEDKAALKLKSDCLFLLDRPDEAFELMEELLDNYGYDNSLYLFIVECYESMKMYPDILECLDKYPDQETMPEELIAKKISTLLHIGENQKALDTLTIGLNLYPDSPDLNDLKSKF